MDYKSIAFTAVNKGIAHSLIGS